MIQTEQKQTVYTMLKKCSAYFSDGTDAAFAEETPAFPDISYISDIRKVAVENASVANNSIENGVKNIVTIESIAAEVKNCTACPLCSTRKNAVPGIGPQNPLVLVVGEAPGEQEDLRGEPFVGAAGQLLDKMLLAISLSRTANCFIANTIKCRPPNNRDPLPQEENACAHFLENQIAILHPSAILAVGRIAAQKLLNTTDGINRLRGKFFDYSGIPFMATFHPSAVLRDTRPEQQTKKDVWRDLQIFRERLRQIAPDYETAFTGGSQK
ncbi:MAG: uracil-DNA glycosylase [Treponemataceae bacterium]|nr:MAG: uracil-DNA glycosylase [Treponemataceae bacterium]